MGRPTKLTKEVMQTICQHIEEGLPLWAACAMAGVVRASYHNWMKRAEEGRGGIYAQFRDEVEAAQARCLARLVKKVEAEAGGAKWLAERRFWNDFGPRSRVEVSGPMGRSVPVRVAPALPLEEEIDRAGQILEILMNAGVIPPLLEDGGGGAEGEAE